MIDQTSVIPPTTSIETIRKRIIINDHSITVRRRRYTIDGVQRNIRLEQAFWEALEACVLRGAGVLLLWVEEPRFIFEG